MVQDHIENDIFYSLVELNYKYGRVSAKDIAEKLGMQVKSIKFILKMLLEKKFVEFDLSNNIHLTPKGEVVAHDIYDCRKFLENIFAKAGVDKEVARYDAANIEAIMSFETYEGLVKLCKEKLNRGPEEQKNAAE